MTGKFRPLLGSPAARMRKVMADFHEVWYCGAPSMLVVKFGSGNIQIIKPSQMIYYSAKENLVTITKKPQRDFKLYEISDMLESMLENAQGQGAKVKYEQATYDNQPAIRVRITRTSDRGFSDTSVMAEKTSRRIRATSSITYSDNSKLVNFDNKFEYPATGPRDIFEAGAPPDAKIITETDF
ncbi:MAG: hypothetical protein A2Y07_07505 [Planctomycetes bacterium GWF2_50_10]|nr:MAG: hypothetical protein A2Y07_07505 [Planctomycetes bacterium GWF2_50_10]